MLTALSYPTTAGAAASCQAPPGVSGLDQYCESIPAPTGVSGVGDKSRSHLPGISPATRRALAKAGPVGGAVAELAPAAPRSTAKSGGSKSGRKTTTAPSKRPAASAKRVAISAPRDVSGGALSAIGSATQTGVSAGSGFAWMLVAITVLLGGLGWMRYRLRSE